MPDRVVTVQDMDGFLHAWTPNILLTRCGANVLGFRATDDDWPPPAGQLCPDCRTDTHRTAPPTGPAGRARAALASRDQNPHRPPGGEADHPVVTVRADAAHSKPHAVRAGSDRALCGTSVTGMSRTGPWPPPDPDPCRVCLRLYRLHTSPGLLATPEGPPTSPRNRPAAPPITRKPGSPAPDWLGPGLRHLWDHHSTT